VETPGDLRNVVLDGGLHLPQRGRGFDAVSAKLLWPCFLLSVGQSFTHSPTTSSYLAELRSPVSESANHGYLRFSQARGDQGTFQEFEYGGCKPTLGGPLPSTSLPAPFLPTPPIPLSPSTFLFPPLPLSSLRSRPLSIQLGGLWERCKLPQLGLGRSRS